MSVYYNENDPQAAAWLRELINQGELPDGVVDERSIEDITPQELLAYDQAHFFAGIGGWPLVLEWAGWPRERPVWTGSCPCQPFSTAGQRKGDDDPRALWWAWRWLIEHCQPPTVFGEQVASKDGRHWLAGVRADLETLGYAIGAADLCAAGVGAPHLRQRLWWVAHAGECSERVSESQPDIGELQGPRLQSAWENAVWIDCADGKTRRLESGLEPLVDGLSNRVGLLRGYGNGIVPPLAQAFVESFMLEVSDY